MSQPPDADAVQTAITGFWDTLAADYDKAWAHGLHTSQEKLAWSALLSRVLPCDRPLRILDVGCGTGFLTLLLAEAGHRVVGVDLSEAMLAQARRSVGLRGLDATVVRGDATCPDAGLGVFDAVVSRHLLWTLPSPGDAVRAWKRLLVPGGRIVAIDGFWISPRAVDRVAAGVGRLLHGVRHGRVRRQSYRPELVDRLPWYDLTELDPVRGLLADEGLTHIVVEPLTAIDRVERAAMPLAQRLQLRHRRYLACARVPD